MNGDTKCRFKSGELEIKEKNVIIQWTALQKSVRILWWIQETREDLLLFKLPFNVIGYSLSEKPNEQNNNYNHL